MKKFINTESMKEKEEEVLMAKEGDILIENKSYIFKIDDFSFQILNLIHEKA
jgi:hypothetical protein